MSHTGLHAIATIHINTQSKTGEKSFSFVFNIFKASKSMKMIYSLQKIMLISIKDAHGQPVHTKPFKCCRGTI